MSRTPSCVPLFTLNCCFVAAAVLCFASCPVYAKHVYSYRDDKGVLHFSDQKPLAEKSVNERLLHTDAKPWFEMREERLENMQRHFVRNFMAGPLQAITTLTTEGDLRISPAPIAGVINQTVAGLSEALLCEVATGGGGGKYQMRSEFFPGPPGAMADANARYQLPFAKDASFAVHQAFGGGYSHTDPYNFYAVDFAMPVGTAIRAARGGIVMEMESDFDGAGTNLQRYGDRANYIRVLHSDGTMAVYAHLDLEGNYVSLGQKIDAGDLLARSGNTGFTTGPHLHFVVQKNRGGDIVSIPFGFWINNTQVEPSAGAFLGAAMVNSQNVTISPAN
jgi:murein DD-endopeptidase MepM/ murein hydrolase activator NlpD